MTKKQGQEDEDGEFSDFSISDSEYEVESESTDPEEFEETTFGKQNPLKRLKMKKIGSEFKYIKFFIQI